MAILTITFAVSVLATSVVAGTEFLYYFPRPDATQKNITGYYPPYLYFPVPNQTMSNITSYYSAPCNLATPAASSNASKAPSTTTAVKTTTTNRSITTARTTTKATTRRMPTSTKKAAPCIPSSSPALDSPIRICKLGPSTSITFTKNITLPKGSGVSKEDLYLLSDVTGSMGSAIATVKSQLNDIILARTSVSKDVWFGVGSYGDEADSGYYGFKNLQPITADVGNIKTALDTLSAFGGGDIPEADLVALHVAATSNSIGWRDGSRKIVAMFGDAPGHEPSCINGTAPLTRYTVASELQAMGIVLVAVNLGGMDAYSYSHGCKGANANAITPGGQASYITNTTGGEIIAAADAAKVVSKILQAVGSLHLLIEADTSECFAAGLAVAFNPPLPLSVAPGTSIPLTQTFIASPSVCSTPAPFKCTIRYTASGAAFTTQDVALSC